MQTPDGVDIHNELPPRSTLSGYRLGHPRKVVLDTSLFVNPDVKTSLGTTPAEALETFLYFASQIQIFEFYMPPSVFNELLYFVDRRKLPGELLVHLHQKPPRKHDLRFPAVVFYDLIEEMRERVNRGLRIAENAARNTAKAAIEEVIQDLRRKYRDALREGIIDSKEDVDLLLLALELDAILVTADNGLVKWAEKLGIEWLFPEKFKDFLLAGISKTETLLKSAENDASAR